MRLRKWLTLAATMIFSGCEAGDSLFCGSSGCEFSAVEWSQLSSLAGFSGPAADLSNAVSTSADGISLGHQLYFDQRLSGNATLVDTLGRPTQYARAPLGQPTKLSCATCHVPTRAGADFSSSPGNTSIGAGTYDVNSQQTVNSGAYTMVYWNGRNDSLWAQIIAVMESRVSMGGNRLAAAWLMQNTYRETYSKVFAAYPLPFGAADLAVASTGLSPDGTCKLDLAMACPAGCRSVMVDTASVCLPRFPLQGRPGATAGCQWGSATEPSRDAFDCMAAADKDAINRVYVNLAKAIAAYEYQLVSKGSAFDQFIAAGPASSLLDGPARRGAKLFVGKAACVECHSTNLLTDNGFHNIGVPQAGPGVPTEADCTAGSACDCVAGKNCLPWGEYDGLTKLKANAFRRDSKWSDDPTDTSRASWYTIDLTSSMKGAWRTPSLRDVALTPPYMHDGFYKTLGEVVHHYNLGGAETGFAGEKSPRLKPLHLTENEEADLVAFLETLTGAALPDSLTAVPVLP